MKLFVKKSLKKGLHCHKCNSVLKKKRIVEGSPRALYCESCDLSYVNYQFYKQNKYPGIEVENEEEVKKITSYFVKDQLKRKQVQEILKKDFTEKEIEQKRKELLRKNPDRPKRPTTKPSSTEKFEKVEYKLQKYPDVTIKVYRSFFHVKVAIWFKSSFFNRRNGRDPIHLKDSRTDITVSFSSKEGLKRCCRTYSDEEFIVVESTYAPLNDTVNLSGEYVAQPDFIRINKAHGFGFKIDAYVNKRYYIPESANASYETFMKQQKLEGKGPAIGYVSNRNKAQFEYTNVTNPFQGGRVSPR